MSINYDFIVVGGGASGAILSAALAEKGKTLLIERGANHSLYFPSKIRQGWPQISGIAWKAQRADDSNHWTGTANILGGGSAVNGGACWRAKPEVFAALGFDYEGEAQEIYKILEAQLCDPAPDNDYNQAFRGSMAEIGTDLAVDEGLAGRGYTKNASGIYVNRAKAIFDTETGFRRPSSHIFEQGSGFKAAQANLTVVLLTTATRVVIDERSMKAQGVELTSEILGNFTARIRKNGKVFLNAGVFETPKLLMLSGVGPKAILKEHGIPVLVDNPFVGQNLVDRKSIYVSIPQLTKKIDGDDTTILDYVSATENMWVSLIHKLAVPWGNAAFGCVACAAEDRTVACQEQLQAALVLYGNGAVPGTQLLELVSLYAAQRNPRSRGHVELASSNFRDNVRVFDGWNTRIEDLSKDALHDLSIIVDGAYELIVDLLRNTSYIEKLGHPVSKRTGEFAAETVLALEELKGLFSNLSQECKISADFNLNCSSWTECTPTLPPLPLDREALTRVIFNNLASSQHGAGTCQVGKVVNKRNLQVVGVQSLHIADLSILDAATDVHPMLTAMAIGALAGKQIDSLGEELPEMFPVVFAIAMVVLATLFSLAVVRLQLCPNSKQSSNSETEGPMLVPIWLRQSLRASGQAAGGSQTFFSASNADATSNSPNVPEEGEIVPVTPNLLAWHRLCCSYNMKRGDDRITLSNATGAMRQGELVAIMGASGSGKSTLLDILSGRKSVGTVSGDLSIVGTEINEANEAGKLLREISAYIPQQEAFYPTQSPQEAVLFTARLKLGGEFTQADAQSLLDAVGLKEEVSKRPIGGTLPGGIVIRGLSGGERKRLALACAVAIKPRLLFLDEITSGLDSGNALAVVKLLKNLCQIRRVAAALVIHQPSGEMFELVDSLVLLSSGKCIFSGGLDGLPDFFRDTFKTDYPAQHMVPNRLLKEAMAGEARGIFDGEIQERMRERGLLETKALTSRPRTPPTRWFVFTTVFTRNLTNHYVRNLGNVAARILLYTALSAIDGAIFWQVAQPESEGGALPLVSSQVVIGAFTFLIMISFLLPFAMIPVFVFDKKFFAAESALGLYSPIIYCISQALLETWILTICALCEACVIIPMGGLWNPVLPRWGAFFTVCGSLIASCLTGSGLVLVCTMVFPSQDLAFLAGSGVVTVALGVSGGFVPFTSMEGWISWLQWVSPCKYSLQALAIGQFGNSNSEIVLEVSALDSPNSVSANIGVLLCFYVAFTVGTVLALSRQREVR